MKTKTYTYDIVGESAVIRYANETDLDENLFDDLEDLKKQLTKEDFDIEYNF
jgi:hypothetical protein